MNQSIFLLLLCTTGSTFFQRGLCHQGIFVVEKLHSQNSPQTMLPWRPSRPLTLVISICNMPALCMMSSLLSYYLYYLHLIVLAALVSRIAGPMGFSRSALSMFYSCSAENIARGNSTTIFID